mgnify:CR=1 FL=1
MELRGKGRLEEITRFARKTFRDSDIDRYTYQPIEYQLYSRFRFGNDQLTMCHIDLPSREDIAVFVRETNVEENVEKIEKKHVKKKKEEKNDDKHAESSEKEIFFGFCSWFQSVLV